MVAKNSGHDLTQRLKIYFAMLAIHNVVRKKVVSTKGLVLFLIQIVFVANQLDATKTQEDPTTYPMSERRPNVKVEMGKHCANGWDVLQPSKWNSTSASTTVQMGTSTQQQPSTAPKSPPRELTLPPMALTLPPPRSQTECAHIEEYVFNAPPTAQILWRECEEVHCGTSSGSRNGATTSDAATSRHCIGVPRELFLHCFSIVSPLFLHRFSIDGPAAYCPNEHAGVNSISVNMLSVPDDAELCELNASTNRTYIASNFTPAVPLAHLHLRPLADLVPRPARRPACQDQCRLPIVKFCGGSVRMCTGHVLLFVFGLDAKSGGLGFSRREEPKPDSSGHPDFKYRGSPSSLSLV
jgi:hypothetical protein